MSKPSHAAADCANCGVANQPRGLHCSECGHVNAPQCIRSTYRREADVTAEIGREARATGIRFSTLARGSR